MVGAGALGSLFGGRLAAAGLPVTLVDPWTEHIEAIRADGLLITGPGAGERLVAHPRAVTTTAAVKGTADLVLLTVKATATAAALESLGPVLGPGSRVLTLQNGLGNAEAIAARVGAARTLVGVTAQGARVVAPGQVHHAGGGPTQLGPYWEAPAGTPEAPAGTLEAAGTPEAAGAAGAMEAAEAVAALLNRAGFAAAALPPREVQAAVWSKLLVNAGINPLTALLGVTNGRLAELPAARELLAAAVAEGAAVARGLEISLLYPDPVAHTLAVARATAANRSSMLSDVERRRPTEVRQINGAIAEAARELGLAAPVNQTLTLLVAALEQSWAKPEEE